MKHIGFFQAHTNYAEFFMSSAYSLPNVSVCFEEKEIHYDHVEPDYITFTPTTDEEVYIRFCAGYNQNYDDGVERGLSDTGYTYEYSLDGGEWTPYIYGQEITLYDSTHNVRFRHRLEYTDRGIFGYEPYGAEFGYGQLYGTGGNLSPVIPAQKKSESDEGCGRFYLSGGLVDCTGNIATLLDGFGTSRRLSEYAFAGLFFNCDNLHTAPILPYITIPVGAYYLMFHGCTSLVNAPVLDSVNISDYCYFGMFAFCESLTTAPYLPATTIYEHSYQYMFFGCKSLTSVQSTLPATNLKFYDSDDILDEDDISIGFDIDSSGLPFEPIGPGGGDLAKGINDFENLKSEITDILLSEGEDDESYKIFLCNIIMNIAHSNSTLLPLPGGEGGWQEAQKKGGNGLDFQSTYGCYAGMFCGCSSLTQAPSLPSTNFGFACYQCMFAVCSSLQQFGQLNAMKLEPFCYHLMFAGTSLLSTPELPSQDIADFCYSHMFAMCSALTSAMTILPAMSLYYNCYAGMFIGCSSLERAPELPAINLLAPNCYGRMFASCSSLNYIKCMAAVDLCSTSNYTNTWVDGVSDSGTFVKYEYATYDCESENAIPYGWTVSGASLNIDYVKFAPTTNEPVTIKLSYFGNESNGPISIIGEIDSDRSEIKDFCSNYYIPQVQYSLNGGEWTDYDFGIYYYEGEVITLSSSTDNVRFRRAYDPEGNMYSNIGGDNYSEVGPCRFRFITDGGMVGVSGNVNTLLEWSGSITKLKQNGNTDDNIAESSEPVLKLPSGFNIDGNCCEFAFLFSGCTNLASIPYLPSETLGLYSYLGMFAGSNIVTPPSLSAVTEIDEGSCLGMFSHCTEMETAPSINVDYLPHLCFSHMFEHCYSLTSAATITASSAETSSCYCMYAGCTGLTTPMSVLPSYLVPYEKGSGGGGPKTREEKKSGGLLKSGNDYGDDVASFNSFHYDCAIRAGAFCCMFIDCFSLLSAPMLPSSSAFAISYANMFCNCFSLQKAPDLPARYLEEGCYYAMFSNCQNMTSAMTVLPAKNIDDGCYQNMFAGCTSLTTAPKIKATSISGPSFCLAGMFSGCSSLNEIEIWFNERPSNLYNGELSNWVSDISSAGTFIIHYADGATVWTENDYGPSGVPEYWDVVPPLDAGAEVKGFDNEILK